GGNGEGGGGNEKGGARAAALPPTPAAAGGTAGVLAIILHAHSAVLAVSAAPGAVHNHGVSRGEPSGTGASLLDPACVLMAESKGKLDRSLGRGPLHQVEIGVTGACTANFHKNLPRPELGHRHLTK